MENLTMINTLFNLYPIVHMEWAGICGDSLKLFVNYQNQGNVDIMPKR